VTAADVAVADASDLTPHGLMDADAAADGAEIAEQVLFHAEADPDALTRHETVPVRMTALWQRTDAGGNAVVGLARERTTRSTIAPRSSDQSGRWLGLALMRTGPYDPRPGLLALVRWQADAELAQLVAYGSNYVRSWAAMAGKEYSADVLRAAAVDALAIVVAGRESRAPRAGACLNRHRQPVRMTLAKRARQLRVDVAEYGELRKVAVSAYTRRLKEAEARYTVVDDYRPVSNGRHYGDAFSRDIRMQPSITTAELIGTAAHVYHLRKPTQPAFEWRRYNAARD
jgi:hypothetical protein